VGSKCKIFSYFLRPVYSHIYLKLLVKVNLSLYRSWRPLGLREVEAPTFSDIRLTDGGKVVSRFLPPGKFLVLISVRG
jgi:hypothetical protein